MRGEHGAIEDPARRGKPPGCGGWRAALVVGLAALGHGAMPAVATADRVALVIGNSAYEHTSELPNPVNDATAMRDALTRLGFDVVFRRDADEDAMDDALGAFEEMSAGAELALVFYAGHGMEMNGGNYLVPVDARLSSSAAVGRETVALDDVLNAVAEARTRIVILDACRNNPFARSMRGAVRANVRSGGLAAVAAGAGSLVAYAAAAGDVADDGAGRHSPFTEALLAQIEQPGVEVRIMLGNVGEAVRARTGRQQPFVYSSLSGEHYLGDVSVGPNPAAVEAALGLDESARRAVQRGLVSAGFAAGAPDGVFGSMTRAAIRAWQRSRGGTPNGYLDAASAAALGAGGASAAPSPTSAGTTTASSPQQETVFWQSIQGSTDPADFEAYLGLFPNGTFAPLARNRLAALGRLADAPRPGAPAAAAAPVAPDALPPSARPPVAPDASRRPAAPTVFVLGFYRNEARDFASRCPKVRFASSLSLASFVVMRSRESMTSGWMELLDAEGNLVTATAARLERNRIDDICENIPSSGLLTVQEVARAARQSSSVENSAVGVFVRNSGFNHNTPLTRDEVRRFAQQCPRVRFVQVIGLADYIVTNTGNVLALHNTRGDWWRHFSVYRRQNLFNDVCEYLSSR